ncbi:hypothetical protein IPJ72_04870 [Candidatus Peregrinibacteria bacterium]|nr:MAG: hypothetical protein IPJ72_04870 [Candidatus Peregrinibacteria bacterium]
MKAPLKIALCAALSYGAFRPAGPNYAAQADQIVPPNVEASLESIEEFSPLHEVHFHGGESECVLMVNNNNDPAPSSIKLILPQTEGGYEYSAVGGGRELNETIKVSEDGAFQSHQEHANSGEPTEALQKRRRALATIIRGLWGEYRKRHPVGK